MAVLDEDIVSRSTERPDLCVERAEASGAGNWLIRRHDDNPFGTSRNPVGHSDTPASLTLVYTQHDPASSGWMDFGSTKEQKARAELRH